MKKIFGLIVSCLFIVSTSQLSSCGHKSDSPVDRVVEVLEQTTKNAEQLTSNSELSTIQNVIHPEEAVEIIRENSDYVLTDSDKEKLKKSFDKLLRVAYEKTAEVADFPEDMKKNSMSQLKLVLEGVNNLIDNSTTLGEISRFK